VLIPKRFWAGIADGSVTVAFRRWKRPTVRAGGHLRSPAGYLAIDAVRPVADEALTDALARRAGFADLAALRKALGPPVPDRTLYRIDFHRDGVDPRDALRADAALGDDALDDLRRRLDRMDASAAGPWTRSTLQLIADRPGEVSTTLAEAVGQERATFKANVRKLKALGLTESLDVGYRLSPRGRAALARLTVGSATASEPVTSACLPGTPRGPTSAPASRRTR
jgi:hypothetical protein